MKGRTLLGRFMFQGTLGKGQNVPFGPKTEAIADFALAPTTLSGTIRPRLDIASLSHLILGCIAVALGLSPFFDAEVPFDLQSMIVLCGLGALLLLAQMFLWSRRCRITVAAGTVRVEQNHMLLKPLVMEIPLSEFRGLAIDRFGLGRRPLCAVLLVHEEWAKAIPLAWSRDFGAVAATLGRYGAALNLPAIESGETFPADTFNLPLPDKVARGVIAAGKPGTPPPQLAVEWQEGRTHIHLTPKLRLTLEGRTATFETCRFGRWSQTWSTSLSAVQNVQLGQWWLRRKVVRPAVVLRMADGLRFAGPCPDDESARWLKATIIAKAVA